MTDEGRSYLLAVLAHPDDETFGCGGVLAKYSAQGIRVGLVCATRGEVGEIADPTIATQENLAEVREQELRDACEVLGIEDLRLLDYRDSGMVGTPDNEHLRALNNADQDKVVGEVVRVIRQTKPAVVITFDPSGGYGHPDHIFIHHATRIAFYAAGEPAMYPEHIQNGLQPFRPHSLYYMVFPRSAANDFQKVLRDAGIDSDFGDMENNAIGVPDEEVTTLIDVSAHAEAKERAALCHRSQIGIQGFFPWMPSELKDRFLSTEHLIRVEPPIPTGFQGVETELLMGFDK